MDKFSLRIIQSLVKLTVMGTQMKTRSMDLDEYYRYNQPELPVPSIVPQDMPTTKETVEELKRRLAKELYRLELDLANGGRIAGKPCDCLGKKHHLGIEATAEELMAYERNPVYNQVITWLNRNAADFEPAEIAKHPEEYYQRLIPDVRNFRKDVMGTENPIAILTNGEKHAALEKIKQELGSK